MTKSRDTETAPLRSTGKIVETKEGRNPSGSNLDETEAEAKAEGHEVVTHGMNRSSPTSEPYSEALAEEEKRARIGRPTLGTRSIRRL
jgi:hypothetical protein